MVPKGQSRSKTNAQGPKVKWVPKYPPSALNVQDNIKRNGHNTWRKGHPRVSHESVKATSLRRTHGASIAVASESIYKKQLRKSQEVCSTSRMGYHIILFNSFEENKRRRISQALKFISAERPL